jgi:hypothetical protein
MKFKTILLAGAMALGAALPAAAQELGVSRINATVPFGEGGGGIPSTNRFAKRASADGSDILALSSSVFIANTVGAPQIDFTLDDFVPIFIAPMAPLYYVSPSTGTAGRGGDPRHCLWPARTAGL